MHLEQEFESVGSAQQPLICLCEVGNETCSALPSAWGKVDILCLPSLLAVLT